MVGILLFARSPLQWWMITTLSIFLLSRYYDGTPQLDDRNFKGDMACVKLYNVSIDVSQVDMEDWVSAIF